MTPVETWAAGAAFIAGSAVAIRARMLRPHHPAWIEAPTPVWLGLSLLALALLMVAAAIAFGAAATPREAAVYTILALVAVVMLWNLNRSGRLLEAQAQRDRVLRARIEAAVRADARDRGGRRERGRA